MGPIYLFAGPGLLVAWTGSRLAGSDLPFCWARFTSWPGLVHGWLGPIYVFAGSGLLLAWSGSRQAGSDLRFFAGSGLRLAWSGSLLVGSDLLFCCVRFTFSLVWFTVGGARFTFVRSGIWFGLVWFAVGGVRFLLAPVYFLMV